ncbi:uncharacterized protein LOC5512203 isoform X1 [Nematostella vectensis]|uniref:uncharacterized protein LOC5512203 isoform X1 n=1 Tax=Nematostella vectensis TaxID=45351 RepID=UPI002077567F|nr:uncharacterized protein LOC5512203 isoform X1 [Nematostella vectensis]
MESEDTETFTDPGLKDQCLLSVFEDPNPSNEFPDGLIAEMTSMDKDDFESLLLGTSVAPTTSTSLVPPLDVVCHADNALVSSLMSDCDQAMSPVESAFATSVSTTPTMSPSPFSYSPSSESGYEDDCEQDGGISRQANAWMECDDTPALADLLKNNTAFLPEAKTSQQESTIQRACEELQKLIASTCNSTVQMPATVASVSTQAASPTLPSYTQNGLVSAPLSTTIGLATTSDPMDITRNHLSVPSADKTAICEPKLVLLEEPEENYRARYESEGCRGPIHGSSDNTFPTVKVLGYSGSVWITVHLVTSSGQPHYHSIHGPGSTKVPCKEFLLPGEIPAVQVLVEPDCDMTAILDSLSIRRLRNWEGDKELKKRGIDPRTWKKERKEARLLFQADIPAKDGLPEMKLSCKSRIFQCSSSGATGNPEIWWTSRTEGCVEGGEELGLIGKKFPTGFKVRFSANLPSGKVWEALVDCDKNKSHQGAGVICTPPFFDLNIMSPMRVNLEVLSTSKNAKCSDPVEFTYQPRPHNSAIANVSACLSTPGQDSIAQGGFVTALQGGTTITTLPSCSKLINCTATPMQPCVVPAQTKESDETDWQRIIVQLKELHQKGEITTQNIKDLCVCIQNKDLLLLQAFRSAKNAGTIEECQLKFKQYLSHLLEAFVVHQPCTLIMHGSK